MRHCSLKTQATCYCNVSIICLKQHKHKVRRGRRNYRFQFVCTCCTSHRSRSLPHCLRAASYDQRRRWSARKSPNQQNRITEERKWQLTLWHHVRVCVCAFEYSVFELKFHSQKPCSMTSHLHVEKLFLCACCVHTELYHLFCLFFKCLEHSVSLCVFNNEWSIQSG